MYICIYLYRGHRSYNINYIRITKGVKTTFLFPSQRAEFTGNLRGIPVQFNQRGNCPNAV